MDPISAVGIAASIAQFVGLGLKVVARLKEYNSATTDIPKSLQRISSQLPLLLGALERIKTGAEVEKVDINTRCILKGVVAGCTQQVEKIDKIIERVLHVPGDSLVTKVQKVFVSLKNDEKVLAIEKNLQTYISILILHEVIQGPDISLTANEDTFYFEVRVKKVSPFYERVELQEIEAHLHPAITSQVLDPIMIALVGEEAVGKTQLALEYCHQANALGHFQTIFWLNATTPQNLSRSLESTSDIIRRSKEGLNNESDKIGFVKSFLCKRWHPWLLVLDNYDPAEFKDIMGFLPSKGSGAILLTSRSKQIPSSVHLIQVPKFRSPEELDQIRYSLVKAVCENDVDRIRVLLDDGADPNSRDDSDWPCLHRAIEEENEATVKLLLEKGASVRARFDGYVTALYRAVLGGNTSITRLLLDEEDNVGPTLSMPDNNYVFSVAVSRGYKDIVQMMIGHKSVDLARLDNDKQSFLSPAAKYGHISIVKILLDHEADTEGQGTTPLTWAVKENHLDIVKLLYTQGKVNINAGNLINYDGQTPLWHAVSKYRLPIDMVKYLLESGADPNRSGENYTSPLQEAVLRESESVVSILLEYGADPYPSEYYDSTPICKAVRYDYENITKLLVQAKAADSAVRVQQLEQALILASANGQRNSILILLDAGVNINVVGNKGMTPLFSAIEDERTRAARLLLRRGARSDIPDEDGEYPLHLAARKGLDLIVKDILRSSKNPDLQNRSGDTPLCLAADKGHDKVVKVLLEYGANPDIVNKLGDAPLDLAIDGKHDSTVEILESSKPQ